MGLGLNVTNPTMFSIRPGGWMSRSSAGNWRIKDLVTIESDEGPIAHFYGDDDARENARAFMELHSIIELLRLRVAECFHCEGAGEVANGFEPWPQIGEETVSCRYCEKERAALARIEGN